MDGGKTGQEIPAGSPPCRSDRSGESTLFCRAAQILGSAVTAFCPTRACRELESARPGLNIGGVVARSVRRRSPNGNGPLGRQIAGGLSHGRHQHRSLARVHDQRRLGDPRAVGLPELLDSPAVAGRGPASGPRSHHASLPSPHRRDLLHPGRSWIDAGRQRDASGRSRRRDRDPAGLLAPDSQCRPGRPQIPLLLRPAYEDDDTVLQEDR